MIDSTNINPVVDPDTFSEANLPLLEGKLLKRFSSFFNNITLRVRIMATSVRQYNTFDFITIIEWV